MCGESLLSWIIDVSLLAVSSHRVKKARALSEVSFLKVLLIPKTLPLNISLWGLEFEHINFGDNTNIQSMAVIMMMIMMLIISILSNNASWLSQPVQRVDVYTMSSIQRKKEDTILSYVVNENQRQLKLMISKLVYEQIGFRK